MGGLSRRAYILNTIRKEEKKPVLAVDAGAMLFPQHFLAPSIYSAKTIQAEGLLEAMARMNYDAVGLAPQDLPAGPGFLLKEAEEERLPWLSANLVGRDSGELFFPASIVKTIGNLSVGIIGLTDSAQSPPDGKVPTDFLVTAWEESLEKSLAPLKDQADIIILLSSLPEATNREIAEGFNDIHLIIQAGNAPANRRPQLHGNTLIIQVAGRGKYLGRLDIDWKPSRTWEQFASETIKPVRDRLDRINWQIGRIEKRYPAGEADKNQQYRKLQEEKRKLTDELQQLESQQQKTADHLSTYQNEFISLSVSLPEDPEIREIVHRTKLAVNRSHQDTLRELKSAGPPAGNDPFSDMAGWEACRTCHGPQTDFWRETPHAKAWATLEKAEQQFNPDCLPCHVTLPTYDLDTVIKRNILAGLKEEFQSVGCETCHGPSRAHVLQPDRFRPAKPDERICLSCHTPERDDNFVYLEKVEKIRCPAAGNGE